MVPMRAGWAISSPQPAEITLRATNGRHILVVAPMILTTNDADTGTYLLNLVKDRRAGYYLPRVDEGGPDKRSPASGTDISAGDLDPWTFTPMRRLYQSQIIGQSITTQTRRRFRGAVMQYGTHFFLFLFFFYLGICCRRFLRGTPFTRRDLNGGVAFDFTHEFKGKTHVRTASKLHGPRRSAGCVLARRPQLSGWGSVVAKFPMHARDREGQSGKGFVILLASTWRLRKTGEAH